MKQSIKKTFIILISAIVAFVLIIWGLNSLNNKETHSSAKAEETTKQHNNSTDNTDLTSYRLDFREHPEAKKKYDALTNEKKLEVIRLYLLALKADDLKHIQEKYAERSAKFEKLQVDYKNFYQTVAPKMEIILNKLISEVNAHTNDKKLITSKKELRLLVDKVFAENPEFAEIIQLTTKIGYEHDSYSSGILFLDIAVDPERLSFVQETLDQYLSDNPIDSPEVIEIKKSFNDIQDAMNKMDILVYSSSKYISNFGRDFLDFDLIKDKEEFKVLAEKANTQLLPKISKNVFASIDDIYSFYPLIFINIEIDDLRTNLYRMYERHMGYQNLSEYELYKYDTEKKQN